MSCEPNTSQSQTDSLSAMRDRFVTEFFNSAVSQSLQALEILRFQPPLLHSPSQTDASSTMRTRSTDFFNSAVSPSLQNLKNLRFQPRQLTSPSQTGSASAMTTRFPTDFFNSVSQIIQNLEFLRFPPPRLSSSDFFNFDNLSWFNQVTSLNSSTEVDRFSVNESLSKFFTGVLPPYINAEIDQKIDDESLSKFYSVVLPQFINAEIDQKIDNESLSKFYSVVLPQFINAEIDQQIAMAATSKEKIDGFLEGAANTMSTLFEFERPEHHLSSHKLAASITLSIQAMMTRARMFSNRNKKIGNCHMAISSRKCKPLVVKASKVEWEFGAVPAMATTAIATVVATKLATEPMVKNIFAILGVALAVNFPLGMLREHGRASPLYLNAYISTLPLMPILCSTLFQPELSISYTIGVSLLGQILGQMAEQHRLKILHGTPTPPPPSTTPTPTPPPPSTASGSDPDVGGPGPNLDGPDTARDAATSLPRAFFSKFSSATSDAIRKLVLYLVLLWTLHISSHS